MGSNIIVTGAFGALGRAVVARLRRDGCAVAAIDMASPLPDQEAVLVSGGVDLADEPSVVEAYMAAAERLGAIHGVVNVAGGFVWETVQGGAIDSWDTMYRANLRTAAVSARAALRHFSANGGAIVNVGAAAADRAALGMAPYAASKAGVLALTESLAEELRGRRIRVNAVLPTILDTPRNREDMPDADRSAWVAPQAAADVIAFLLSDAAAAITGAGIRLS